MCLFVCEYFGLFDLLFALFVHCSPSFVCVCLLFCLFACMVHCVCACLFVCCVALSTSFICSLNTCVCVLLVRVFG